METYLYNIMKRTNSKFITILFILFLNILIFSSDGNYNVNPYLLPIVGLAAVFAGLILIQVFINILKVFLNPPQKSDKDKKVEDYNKSILEKKELDEEELLAITTALILEYKLHHTLSKDKLTIKWEDKPPYWFYARSKNG
uniref:Oxaloacetate decarboxylase, gamma chain n=1 Tax=candidate division WOR-3 bacterium TaxID=2052148 RepID=A0A7C3J573_UNCW3